MARIATISINGEFWSEERLVKYASKKLNLPTKMDQPGYRLLRNLCYSAMAVFHNRRITLKELDRFFEVEYKRKLMEENLKNASLEGVKLDRLDDETIDPKNLEGVSLEGIDFEKQSKKLR